MTMYSSQSYYEFDISVSVQVEEHIGSSHPSIANGSLTRLAFCRRRVRLTEELRFGMDAGGIDVVIRGTLLLAVLVICMTAISTLGSSLSIQG